MAALAGLLPRLGAAVALLVLSGAAAGAQLVGVEKTDPLMRRKTCFERNKFGTVSPLAFCVALHGVARTASTPGGFAVECLRYAGGNCRRECRMLSGLFGGSTGAFNEYNHVLEEDGSDCFACLDRFECKAAPR